MSLAIEQYGLQWGHALSGMDIRVPLTFAKTAQSFNGAMPFQAWISLRAWHSSKRKDSRFNGAMPFQAWIWDRPNQNKWGVERFNGAMPFQAWILSH